MPVSTLERMARECKIVDIGRFMILPEYRKNIRVVFNFLSRFVLRYIANPCGIKNFSFSHDSRVRFRTEQQVYYFSRDQKILSLIGHTHRPLFESFSKADYLKSKIEQLCREYSQLAPAVQAKLAVKIKLYNNELQQHLIRNKQDALKKVVFTTPIYWFLVYLIPVG